MSFKPDFVLLWGDDQYENFREDIIPPYCIAAHDKFTFSPRPDNVWGETNKTYELPGNRNAAKMLATRLIEQGFDTAYAYKPLHHPLGHAFTNAIFYLDYNRKGFHYPIVPFAVNCYGRKVVSQRGGVPAFDQAEHRRRFRPTGAHALASVRPRRRDRANPGRIALPRCAVGFVRMVARIPDGQEPLSLSRHGRPIDRCMNACATPTMTAWRQYPALAVEDSGQQEILNWMCLVGAMSALDGNRRRPASSTRGFSIRRRRS